MSKKTNEIREEIKKKEERLKRQLTEREKKNIERRIEIKYKRRNFIRGALAALGLTISVGGGIKLLTSSNHEEVNIEKTENKSNSEITGFKESMKIGTVTTEQETTNKNRQDYKEIINQILDQYNEKYDTDLTNTDIIYLRSNPNYLGIDEQGNYIYDSKDITPVKDKVNVRGYVYVIINKNDNKIVSSIGKLSKDIKMEIKNVDTKVAMDWERNEYTESDKKIDFTEGKSQEQIENIYEAIKEDFEERTAEKEIGD